VVQLAAVAISPLRTAGSAPDEREVVAYHVESVAQRVLPEREIRVFDVQRGLAGQQTEHHIGELLEIVAISEAPPVRAGFGLGIPPVDDDQVSFGVAPIGV